MAKSKGTKAAQKSKQQDTPASIAEELENTVLYKLNPIHKAIAGAAGILDNLWENPEDQDAEEISNISLGLMSVLNKCAEKLDAIMDSVDKEAMKLRAI